MALFFAVFVILVRRGNEAVLRYGFYLFVGVYAAQRFVWEFLKPYGTVVGPFNLFHLMSLVLVAYAVLFARREALDHARSLRERTAERPTPAGAAAGRAA